jgi:hypothetical protein
MFDNDTLRCVVCGKHPPTTQSAYTLVSSEFGWRFTRGVDAEGKPIPNAYCPRCWERRKTEPRSGPGVIGAQPLSSRTRRSG